MGKIRREEELFSVVQAMMRQNVHRADVIGRKAGKGFLFRIEQFGTEAAVGQTKADKAIVDQPRQIGFNQAENLLLSACRANRTPSVRRGCRFAPE